MKVSVYNASDMILDYLVAICEGWIYLPIADTFKTGRVFHMMKNSDGDNYVPLFSLQFSKNWSLAGPIMDRECIAVSQYKISVPEHMKCGAYIGTPVEHLYKEYGPTILVAAMRTYVTSKFDGDTIEVPDTLFQES
ncbi:MAG TPA: phage protein NinX family protein [Methanosarcina sp.]|nr:phage protein NinX family protein [Methanosarcina sp.]